MFKTAFTYSKHENQPSNAGVTKRYEYVEQFNGEGQPRLEIVREYDIPDEINANAEYFTMTNIIKRFTLGDKSAMQQTPGFYADVSDVPTSLVECYNMIQRARDYFDNLPAEKKQEYNNSLEKFMMTEQQEKSVVEPTAEIKEEISNE